jgi:hypothetical protein
VRRALGLCAGGCALAGVCAALMAGWLAPGTVLALWTLLAFCG